MEALLDEKCIEEESLERIHAEMEFFEGQSQVVESESERQKIFDLK